jgi:hypothetical protein
MREGPKPAHIIAVDWGKDNRKRVAYMATLGDRQVARLPFDGSLLHLVKIAKDLEPPVLIGIDAAIGFPRGAWQQLAESHAIQSTNFIDFLLGDERPDNFFEPVELPGEWSAAHPFVRPPRQWSLKAFEVASREGFYRHIDSRLKGKPIFVTCGMPGVVGSGTRALWLEIITLANSSDFRVWPFHGEIAILLASHKPVITEIYPKACYGLVLSDNLPAPLVSLAKTQEAVRHSALDQVLNAKWVKQAGIRFKDLDPARSNEDDFDAWISAIALLRLFLNEHLPACSVGLDLASIEGDVFGADSITSGKGQSFKHAANVPRAKRSKPSDSPNPNVASKPRKVLPMESV